MDVTDIQTHLDKLERDEELGTEGMFYNLCSEFQLSSLELESDLGCADPYALIGYLEACTPEELAQYF